MSHHLDLDEQSEDKLRGEIQRREKLRLAGLCDYCERDREAAPCKFPTRHYKVESQTVFATPSTARLTRWLRDHPDVFTAVVEALGTPVATCEGHSGPCGAPVLWMTPSMTAYEWDGEGDDPNADETLCPLCSESYTKQMQDQWADYYSDRL